MKRRVLGSIILLLFSGFIYAQQLAFPTAEGYGKFVTGGRGGSVYEVTNLNSSGSGSFGDAISSGNRIIVFRVSGTITGSFNLSHSNITIAGQTAPGDGICIRGCLHTSADNLIIRYIRVRWDPAMGENDATGGRYHKNIIYDHVSASWSTDEVFSLYHNENVTIQWCMIEEACPKGTTDAHRFGGIWGNRYGTYHHNLIADNASRNPRWASGSDYNDYRNNVIYNWGYNSCYGGGAVQSGVSGWTFTTINMIANYYKAGPATESAVKRRIAEPSNDGGVGSWYVSGNYVDGYPDVTADNWKGIDGSNYIKMSAPWDAMPINEESPQDAYTSVLNSVGCSYPIRDKVDADVIDDVINGTAKYGKNGIIDSPGDVGGFPTLNSTAAPTDSDHDGMPDSWETAHSLDPNNASDRNNIGSDGYTMVEEYINSLVDDTVAVTGVTINPSSDTVAISRTTQLTAALSPYNATNKRVTWSSGDNSVATVSSSGVVTGVKYGTAVITATTIDGGFTAQSTITVAVVPVTGVSVSPSSTTVGVGGTTQLTANVSPDGASNLNVSWSSSDPSVATVNSSGQVTGVAEGTATITATTEDGSFTASGSVTVLSSSAPLIRLNFDENSGSSVANTGSVSATFTKTGPPSWSTNVPANGGTSSVDFGTTTGNYFVESGAVISQLAGITSFTVTGWVNCRDLTVGSGGNRIVSWINNGGNGVDIVHVADGSLKAGINQWPDKSTAISTSGKITANSGVPASNWKFFAVTYESSTGALAFYFGDNTAPASLDKTLTYNQGTVGTDIGKLAIGHFNAESNRTGRTDRMFKGLIDQVEIFGAPLSLSEIQVVQSSGGTATDTTSTTDTTSVTGLPSVKVSDQDINIYPVPFNNKLNIQIRSEVSETLHISLIDATGRTVRSVTAVGPDVSLDVADLNDGLYLIKITGAAVNITKTIIK